MTTSSIRPALLRAGAFAGAFAVLVAHGRAADWYVDAVFGSDANAGTSAGAAWQTITHAVATIAALPNDVQTIHVAPGVYNSSLGEAFPLSPAPRTRIVGTQGSALTILEGPAVSLLAYHPDTTVPVDAQSGADGLTLRLASNAIGVGSGLGSVAPSFHDIRVENISGVGISVGATGGSILGGASASATITGLEVVGCDVGVRVQSSGNGISYGGAGIAVTDGVIRSSTNEGVRFSATGNGGAGVHLRRCRVLDNGGHGAWGSVSGNVVSASLTGDDCIFAGNQLCGLFTDGANHGESEHLYLNNCTIADNVDCGLRGISGNPGSYAQLWNCVLAHNGDDIDLDPGHATASFCDCANGDLAGFPSCIAADPLFVDPANRDYRLRFGSPCVDSGDPAAAGHVDLAGNVRPFDGDLDAVAVPDMGAFELATLVLAGTPHSGGGIALEITGPAAAPTTVYGSRRGLLALPVATSFGELWLPRRANFVFAQTHADPGPPSSLPIVLTSDPSWIGRTVSFQARIVSVAAPRGSAFSNPLQFTIVP
jgi:hypothetical protein